jgi:hypothetical protein
VRVCNIESSWLGACLFILCLCAYRLCVWAAHVAQQAATMLPLRGSGAHDPAPARYGARLRAYSLLFVIFARTARAGGGAACAYRVSG